jgi:hypothetical protein
LYIQKGKADINVRDNMKRTPLILAVSMGKRDHLWDKEKVALLNR